MIHIDNVEYVLRHGMHTRNHPSFDPNYINIGDTSLIEQRSEYIVRINQPGGILGDYIPFYFGTLSPMLLNIKTGYRGITKRPQSDIIYICCKLVDVIRNCRNWCFTDGHAKASITSFYNNVEDLKNVDWSVVNNRYWNNTEDDYDRMRRKQAEFLIHNYVPVSCINYIVVLNKEKKKFVMEIINELKLNFPVLVNPNNNFYFL